MNFFYSICLITTLIAPSNLYAALIGLSPKFPTINFSGSASISYNSNNGVIKLSADPSSLFSIDPFILAPILGTGINNTKSFNIEFKVDNSGSVITGNSNTPNFLLSGSIDTTGDGISDLNGTLLTAKVTQFGFQNGLLNHDDLFDLRLSSLTGALSYLYNNQNTGIRIISESSSAYNNPFNNNFDASWQGQAKGVLGLTNLNSGGTLIPNTNNLPIVSTFWLCSSLLVLFFPAIKRVK